jgi:cytochrome c biogenesis protein
MKLRYLLVKYLANLQFAVVLLLTIASFSIIGSIIEQDQPLDFYIKTYQQPWFGIFTTQIIIKFGFDHIFRTWWFISLLILFGTSLICCTFLQQLPILKSSQNFKFYTDNQKITRLPFNTKTRLTTNGSLITSLKNKEYQIFQGDAGIYAHKGIIGRISPIVVHFSMVLILFGTILASTSGFIAQEFIPKNEIFYIQNILNNNINTSVPQLSGRVNDFWITYTDEQEIKQYYTDLSLLDNNGNEIKRETIYVNHPLRYKGLTFYQTDWTIIGIRFQSLNSKFYQIPIFNPTKNIWLSWLPNTAQNEIFGQQQSGYTIVNTTLRGGNSVYDQTGKFVGEGEINEGQIFKNEMIFCDYITATGIQIKSDPGIPLIYMGFFLLLLSVISSYLSYSQVWLTQKKNKTFLGGTTNRSKIKFEFEMLNFVLQFQKI